MTEIVIKLIDTAFDDVEILERAYYEVQSRKSLLELMIVDGYKNNENYNDYWEEYLEYIKVYDIIKNNFYNKYLSEYSKGTWSLDFLKKEVTITIEDEE